jgi:hypothetical protein
MQPTPVTAAFAPPEGLLALPSLLPAATPEPAAGGPCPLAPHPGGDAISPRPGRGDGPLRSGNPRGNPNLAPRCGARARSGCPCRAPAMKNGRCRIHGGKSTGPRTPEGLARLAAAHTTHRDYCAGELRDSLRHNKKLCRRMRITIAAQSLRAWLPLALAARLATAPAELWPPPHYSYIRAMEAAARATPSLPKGVAGRDARGRFARAPRPAAPRRAAEREAARVEAAALAPWRAGIARARMIKRLLVGQEQAARRAERGRRAGTGPEARGEKPGQDLLMTLPPGACPGGGAVRADGADGGLQDRAVPRLMAGSSPIGIRISAGGRR